MPDGWRGCICVALMVLLSRLCMAGGADAKADRPSEIERLSHRVERLLEKGDMPMAAKSIALEIECVDGVDSVAKFQFIAFASDFLSRRLDAEALSVFERKASVFIGPVDVPNLTRGEKGALDSLLRKEMLERAKNGAKPLNPLIADNQSDKSRLAQFDALKSLLETLISVAEDSLKTNPEDAGRFKEQLKGLGAMKETLKKERTDYLSYAVVSPWLFEAQRLYVLGYRDLAHFKLRDEAMLRRAVGYAAKACAYDWIYQCHKDVRDQFLDISGRLKTELGNDDSDSYKTIIRHRDCCDKSKPCGADAWMK